MSPAISVSIAPSYTEWFWFLRVRQKGKYPLFPFYQNCSEVALIFTAQRVICNMDVILGRKKKVMRHLLGEMANNQGLGDCACMF